MTNLNDRILVLFEYILGDVPPIEYIDNWIAGDTSKDYQLQEWVLNQKPLLENNPLSWCTAIGIIEGVVHMADYGVQE